MSNNGEVAVWMARRAQEDDHLCERYGRVLEPEHSGEFVAIGPDGRLLVGADELAVATQAEKEFGAGNFALRRVGAEAKIRWRRIL